MMPNHCQCCSANHQHYADSHSHRNATIYETQWYPANVCPCQVVVNKEVRPRFCSFRFQVVRPLCCFADCRQILMVLTCAALLYAIVALILTCLYAPNMFFVLSLAFSIITMICILCGVLSGNNKVLKTSFVLTVILCFLAVAGAVYCFLYIVEHFYQSPNWEWRIYLITMFITQVLLIFYVAGLLFLISQLIAYNRRVREEKQRAQPIATYRRY